MMQTQNSYDDSLDEELVEKTAAAIRATIRAEENSDNLYNALSSQLGAIHNCPITVVDAYSIALQSIEDTGSNDPDSPAWDGYEADQEGVLNHALYHRGRPGECGPNCPALLNQ